MSDKVTDALFLESIVVDTKHELLTLQSDDDWTKPDKSKKAVRRAGELLAAETLDLQRLASEIDDLHARIEARGALNFALVRELRAEFDMKHARWLGWLDAYKVLNTWRSAHMYPLSVLYLKLAECSKEVDTTIFTAFRLKRLPSIIAKLRRFDHMSLARMQDLGGCRAVVSDLPMVYALLEALKKKAAVHNLEVIDDYIATPKDDGYRSIHLVYRFVGQLESSIVYNGLPVEVQLRTKVQHAWATAVETIDLFQKQAIKIGGGDDRWRRFFRLVSEAFAAYEIANLDVEAAPISQDLRDEMAELVGELDVFGRLEHYRKAIQLALQENGPSTFLLKLDLDKNELNVVGYDASEQERAQSDYADAERTMGPDEDVVLVSAEGLQGLREAYPNYFADTRLFLEALQDTLGWVSHDPVPEWLFDDLGKASERD